MRANSAPNVRVGVVGDLVPGFEDRVRRLGEGLDVWPGTKKVAGERIEAAQKPAERSGGEASGRGSGWLRGRGWREEAWPEGERPTRAALDSVTPSTSRPPCARATATRTAAPAWLEGAEQRRGRLSEGYDADLVVLDGERVRATMVAGRWVHGHPRAS